jgi:RimJ/RimL family protein N-acetyltransferase
MNSENLKKLRITTPRLILRIPTNEEVTALAQIALEGIQPKGEPHFQSDELYDKSLDKIESFLREHVNKNIVEWNKKNWQLPFAIFSEDKPIGMITVYAKDFPIAGGFGCGYWLGIAHQGKGLGTEMLQAVLSLGFDGLHAREAYVGAWSDNVASLRIMEKLGFIFNGEYWMARQGQPVKDIRMKLSREKWVKPSDVFIERLDSCLECFKE